MNNLSFKLYSEFLLMIKNTARMIATSAGYYYHHYATKAFFFSFFLLTWYESCRKLLLSWQRLFPSKSHFSQLERNDYLIKIVDKWRRKQFRWTEDGERTSKDKSIAFFPLIRECRNLLRVFSTRGLISTPRWLRDGNANFSSFSRHYSRRLATQTQYTTRFLNSHISLLHTALELSGCFKHLGFLFRCRLNYGRLVSIRLSLGALASSFEGYILASFIRCRRRRQRVKQICSRSTVIRYTRLYMYKRRFILSVCSENTRLAPRGSAGHIRSFLSFAQESDDARKIPKYALPSRLDASRPRDTANVTFALLE